MESAPTRITCCIHDCERPATTLIVNTKHDTFPFKTGAGVCCTIHGNETVRGVWPCERVEWHVTYEANA